MEVGQLTGDLLANPIAQIIAAIGGVATAWRIYKNQTSGDTVTRANDAANVTALATWKELLEGERAARAVAEQRADKFAEERNKAMEEVWTMKGQLKVMSDQIQTQTQLLQTQSDQLRAQSNQINELRAQIAALQERDNAA